MRFPLADLQSVTNHAFRHISGFFLAWPVVEFDVGRDSTMVWRFPSFAERRRVRAVLISRLPSLAAA